MNVPNGPFLQFSETFCCFLILMTFQHSTKALIKSLSTFIVEVEIDDEGIERDSEDIDDEKFVDTKELDHVLEVSLGRLLN